MALILNIETTTPVGSVSLTKDGLTWVMREIHDSSDHAKNLTLFIQEILSTANCKLSDLDAIAVSAGPGSYTGLRIGISVAKGLCYTLQKPLLAVNTLQAMAYGSISQHDIGEKDIIVCLQDARRMDAFAAVYDCNLEVLKAPFFITLEAFSFAELAVEAGKIWVCGTAAKKWMEVVSPSLSVESAKVLAPSSRFLEALGFKAFKEEQFEDVAYYEPFYLKAPNVTKPKKIF
jgi:tRNA threonylcarbamoyladenosine biosynthesis protein TsaB